MTRRRVVALIDGEHYPPVVRFALDELRLAEDVVAAVFLGGTEKVADGDADEDTYGLPVVRAASRETALCEALDAFAVDAVIDLSDEPVVSPSDRFRLASIALERGAAYEGADFRFTPPVPRATTRTPALAIIGTGKRVGKTAVAGYVSRRLTGNGYDLAVLAMGRGGPAIPELIHGERVPLTVPDLLELARQGRHASSDNYEDAVMARVTTVGCRRCGGGLAGETFFSNVPEGARLADELGKELLVLEGSGAAIPPVHHDSVLLVVGAGQGIRYVEEFFGPYRLHVADGVIVASAEEPIASRAQVDDLVSAIRSLRPDIPVVVTTFRPVPVAPIDGKRVFFATTAPPAILPVLVERLERQSGCEVVAASSQLSNRAALREDMAGAAGRYDVLLTELKAAAIDVVASAGEEAGVPTVLCDNVPQAIAGDLDGTIESAASLAVERGAERART